MTKFNLLLIILLATNFKTYSQNCAKIDSLGSSSNAFTSRLFQMNPISVDPISNTIIFVHRQNTNLFGGTSGALRFDKSIDGGLTWSNEIGPINGVNIARYPNALIVNPTNTTNGNNIYLNWDAMTLNAGNFSGTQFGTYNISTNSGTINTDTLTPYFFPSEPIQGANGIFWKTAVCTLSNSYKFIVYKGIWSNALNDIIWSNFDTLNCNPPVTNTSAITVPNIAFDPSGKYGWIGLVGDITGSYDKVFLPTFYKSVDSGNTWTGPIEVPIYDTSIVLYDKHCQFPDNISGALSAGGKLTTNFESDLVVDNFGNPHLVSNIGINQTPNSSPYTIDYTNAHPLFDITLKGTQWHARYLFDVPSGRVQVYNSDASVTTMDMFPNASRTIDGTKLFFGCALSNNVANTGDYSYDLEYQIAGVDILNNKITGTTNKSYCNGTSGIFYPHMANLVLNPSTNFYQPIVVFTEHNSAVDDVSPVKFKFMDSLFVVLPVSFASPYLDTTIGITSALLQPDTVYNCPNDSISLNLVGTHNPLIHWYYAPLGSNIFSFIGSFYNDTLPVINEGKYKVVYTEFCNNFSDSVTIIHLPLPSININVNPSDSICLGSSLSLNATGGNSYLWTGGVVNGIAFSPTMSSNYTVTVTDSNNCSNTATQNIIVNTLPNVVANYNPNDTICLGTPITLFGSGANTYQWNLSVQDSVTFIPTNTATYNVTGTDSNGCQNNATKMIIVNPLPTITAIATSNSICTGDSITLTGTGGTSYNWSGGVTNNTSFIPLVTNTYTVTGTDANNCSATSSILITVTNNVTPSINLTSSSSTVSNGQYVSYQANTSPTSITNYYISWYVNSSLISTTQNPIDTFGYVASLAVDTVCAKLIPLTGCYSPDTVISNCLSISNITSVASIENNPNIKVYPNPVNDKLYIELENNKQANIKLIDLFGNIITKQNISTKQTILYTSSFAKGLYNLEIIIDNKLYNKKIIIQ